MGFQVAKENIKGCLQVAQRFNVVQFTTLKKPLGCFDDRSCLGQSSCIEIFQALQFPVIACNGLPVLCIQPLLLQLLLRPGYFNSRLSGSYTAADLPSPNGD